MLIPIRSRLAHSLRGSALGLLVSLAGLPASAEDVVGFEDIIRSLQTAGDGVPGRARSLDSDGRGIGGVRPGREPTASPARAFTNIRFATGSARIPPEARPQLDEIGRALRLMGQQDPDAVFVLEGHTDSTGDSQVNDRLSRLRAREIADYIGERFGVDESRMDTVGYGENRPVESNATPEGRQANRRVVVARKR